MPKILVASLGTHWAVRREQDPVPLARFEGPADALEYGRMLADACGSDLVVVPLDQEATG